MQHPNFPRIHIETNVISRTEATGTRLTETQSRMFESQVVELIDQINISQVGSVLLHHIQSAGNNNGIRIVPHANFPLVESDYILFGNRANAYARSSRVPDSGERGTGSGTSATIYFEPNGQRMNNCRIVGSPKTVLFHELVHSIRGITGSYNSIPFRNYDNFEEFVAVTLTNMFRSEQLSSAPLRGGHGCETMPDTMDEFKLFYGRFLQRMMQGDFGTRALFSALSRLSIPWNPLAP